MNNIKEFLQINKQLPPDNLQQQKAEEAEEYKSFRLSPSEAFDIIVKSGNATVLTLNFGLDFLSYYKPHVMNLESSAQMLWTLTSLVEVGRIMGIRQERARRKEHKHERA